MSTYAGKDGIMKVCESEGTPGAIGELSDWEGNFTCDMIEDTALGDTAKTYKPGLKDGTVSVNGHFDGDDAGQVDLIEGTEVDLELYPEGSTAGNNYMTASGIVQSFSASNPGNSDTVKFSASIQLSGGVTRTTVGA